MFKILAVEDSPEAFRLIQHSLGSQYKIEWAKTCREAAIALEKGTFDLILLDGNLPDGDGFQLCSMIQTQEAWSTIPVILLTARQSVMDKVMGFSVGADDFVTKPFDPTELKARVESKLRRRERQQRASDTVICGNFEIDRSTQRAMMYTDGVAEELVLTPIEFKLLLLFASQPDIVHSRDSILDAVWGSSVHVFARSVDTHVSKLRKKMGAQADLISSLHGSGYRMERPARPSTVVADAADRAELLSYATEQQRS